MKLTVMILFPYDHPINLSHFIFNNHHNLYIYTTFQHHSPLQSNIYSSTSPISKTTNPKHTNTAHLTIFHPSPYHHDQQQSQEKLSSSRAMPKLALFFAVWAFFWLFLWQQHWVEAYTLKITEDEAVKWFPNRFSATPLESVVKDSNFELLGWCFQW